MVSTDFFVSNSLLADGSWLVEIGFWLVAFVAAGYVFLLYSAFRMFASDNNKKSVLGAALLLLLIGLGLLPLYWLANH